MPTFKTEFQDLAQELINDEFADFRAALKLTNFEAHDPRTGLSSVKETFTVQAIRSAIKNSQFQNELIQATDFNATYTRQGSAFIPTISTEAEFNGDKCQVVAVTLDAADAAVKIVLRVK